MLCIADTEVKVLIGDAEQLGVPPTLKHSTLAYNDHSLTEYVSRLVTKSTAEKERKSANLALSATVPGWYFRELMNRRIAF